MTATEAWCERCDEESPVLVLDPEDPGTQLCPACHAERLAEVEAERREDAISAAQDEVDEAEYELEVLLQDLVEIKGRIGEVRHTLRCARKRLAALSK